MMKYVQFLLLLGTVSAHSGPELFFRVKPGPYEINTMLHMECTITGMHSVPKLQLINITILRNNRTFYSQKTDMVDSDYRILVNASMKLTSRFDKDIALCQATTKSGIYFSKSIHLHTYRKQIEQLQVFENDPVLMTCQSGNVSQHKWVKTSRQDGHSINLDNIYRLHTNANESMYYINKTTIEDEGSYECIEGYSVLHVVSLEVKVLGTLNLTISDRPYHVGDDIDIKCEVPHVKGNISERNLEVFLGDSKLKYGSLINDNGDGTDRLFFYQTIPVLLSYNDVNLTCRYFSPLGHIQEEFFTLQVIGLTQNNHLPVTIGTSLGGTILLGLFLLFGVFKWKKRRRDKQWLKMHRVQRSKGPCPSSRLTISKYDEIDESKIQRPENAEGAGVESDDLAEREKQEELPETIPDYISIESSSSEDNEVRTETKMSVMIAEPTTEQEEIEDYDDTEVKEPFGGNLEKAEAVYINEGQEESGYEIPQENEPSEMEIWLKANSVSQATCEKLHKEMIRKMSDFRGLTKEDIQALLLPVGEQVRLRLAVENLQERGAAVVAPVGNVLKIL